MQETRTGPRRPRLVAGLAIAATVASLLLAPGRATAKPPPPNPSDGQISAAQQHKLDLAAEVGRLGAQTAQMQTRLDRLKAEQELAEQKLALALSNLALAKTAAAKAKATVGKAKAGVAQAQKDFVGYLQASYMGGGVSGSGTLLTAHDPSVLLESRALHDYQSSHQLSAIGNLQRATVAKSNADAAARKAVSVQADLTHVAAVAQDQAVAAVNSAKRQKQQLEASLAANRVMLGRAQLELATLNNQRAVYVAFQKEQARLAALLGGGGGGGGSFVAPGPRGNWTPAAGQQAVNRAMQLLGVPYAWAGGNAGGPTRGVCAGDGAFNDCNVIGVDCSGLVMFAWAQYPFAHYAATQYLQGSVHPDTSSLMPGDLVFWSSDGSVGGIHHVAIYIGGGNVIQAPQSGDIVRITPLGEVSSDYFGATRPLT